MSEEPKQERVVVEGEVITTVATIQLPNGKSIPIEVPTATLQEVKRTTIRIVKTIGGVGQGLNKLAHLLKIAPPANETGQRHIGTGEPDDMR